MSLSAKAFSIFQRDVFLFCTNLLTGVVVARALGPQALGFWIVLQLIPSYAEAVGRLKFDVAAVYLIGKGEHRTEDVLMSINALAFATSMLIVGLLLWQLDFLGAALLGEAAVDLHGALLVLLAQIPLQFFYLNYAYYHIAVEDIAVYNRMVVIRALTNSFLAILLLLAVGLGLWAVVVASLASVASGLGYGWARVDRREFQRGRIDGRIVRALVGYGWHLYLGGLLSHLNSYGTRLIIVFLLVPAQVAFFGLAQGVGLLIDRVPQALGTILFPRISRSERSASVSLAANAYRVTLVLILAAAALLAVLALPIITTLYGERYGPAAGPLRIMLPGVVLAGAGSMLSQYFQGVGRPNLVARIAIVPVVVQVGCAFLFTRWWGLPGAALAVAVGLGSMGLLQVLVFLRITKSGPGSLVPAAMDLGQIRSLLVRTIASAPRPGRKAAVTSAPTPLVEVESGSVDISMDRTP
jgi:O-antigen/teichoic acid export membrane protein